MDLLDLIYEGASPVEGSFPFLGAELATKCRERIAASSNVRK